jgi:hypothetical protein
MISFTGCTGTPMEAGIRLTIESSRSNFVPESVVMIEPCKSLKHRFVSGTKNKAGPRACHYST